MKAQSIWANNEYALIPSRGKNQVFSYNVIRIKVRRITKRKEHGKKNDSTYAVAEVLEWDGTATGREIECRAYDIVDFWEDFALEHGSQLDAWTQELKDRAEREKLVREKRERIKELTTAKLAEWGVTQYRTTVFGDIIIDSKFFEQLMQQEGNSSESIAAASTGT